MNQEQVFFNVLTDHGVPKNLANCAAKILVKDDGNKTDLGRTEADQKVIHQAWLHLSKPTDKE